MGNLSYLKKLASLNPQEILRRALENTGVKQQIIDYNQEQMYEQGIDSAGESLGEYSHVTIKIKQEKGQRIDHITLKDAGDFYDSMRIVTTDKSALIEADMQKPDTDLEIIYPKALGLTEDSKNEIMPMIIGQMMKEIKLAIR